MLSPSGQAGEVGICDFWLLQNAWAGYACSAPQVLLRALAALQVVERSTSEWDAFWTRASFLS